jgi:tRNA (guanine37-N1)-methyltransferase
LILLSPRYEGVDERVARYLAEEEISIGDYILSGAELAAMVFIDCLTRLIPGVVSDKESIKTESFEDNFLDFPSYTRPEDFRGLKVPQILLSGNHASIKHWRREKAIEATKEKRPDLLEK